MSEIEVKAEELKVLADKTRLKIMGLLREKGELSLSELSELTGRAKSTIVEHLKLLLKNGYIDRRSVNKGFVYFLTEKGMKVFPLFEKEMPSLKIEEVERGRKGFLEPLYEIDRMARGKSHLIFSAIAGLSMIILGYLPLSSIILSIIIGLILGLLNITSSEFIESAVIYSAFTALSAILKTGEIKMLFTILPSILIFIVAGGIIFLGVKLIIKEE
ncbi:MAG: winged helix-turn-helix domain-containing protein [archaeon GB-1867-035]|nr:winged helix-turn-helix domain-containing protein [Candidatus Culexmicrobium profundum]